MNLRFPARFHVRRLVTLLVCVVPFPLWIQPIDATHRLNRSAGVSKSHIPHTREGQLAPKTSR